MPKGILNLRYETARGIAAESGNSTKANISRILRELNEINDNGFSILVAKHCWTWLRTREQFPISEARIITALKGSPLYIDQFKEWLISSVPPVFEMTEHDKFVQANGAMLRRLGWKYRVENQQHRLTTEQLVRCGYISADPDIDNVPIRVQCLTCSEWAYLDKFEQDGDSERVVIYRCDDGHESRGPLSSA